MLKTVHCEPTGSREMRAPDEQAPPKQSIEQQRRRSLDCFVASLSRNDVLDTPPRSRPRTAPEVLPGKFLTPPIAEGARGKPGPLDAPAGLMCKCVNKHTS